jgi:hypothetical protein
MKRTTSAENKTLVIEAFDTLFNKRDYAAAERFGRPTTSNIVLTLSLVAPASSI